MARIIYGVAGKGFGHSSRSHLIGQRLLAAVHEVMFIGYHKSLTYRPEKSLVSPSLIRTTGSTNQKA